MSSFSKISPLSSSLELKSKHSWIYSSLQLGASKSISYERMSSILSSFFDSSEGAASFKVCFFSKKSCFLFWSLLGWLGVFFLLINGSHGLGGGGHDHGEVGPGGVQFPVCPAGNPDRLLMQKVRLSFPSLVSMDRLNLSPLLLLVRKSSTSLLIVDV